MPVREILRLAVESLIANRMRTVLTMLGMIIGVGAVVLLVSLGTGARGYITGQFQTLETNLITVQPGKNTKKSEFGPPMRSSAKKLTLADVDSLERLAVNLDSVSGMMYGGGNAKAMGQTTIVTILGVNDRFNRILNLKVRQGQFITREEEDSGRRIAILGHETAKALFQDAADGGIGQVIKVNDSEFRVVGILEKSGQTLGLNLDEFVIVPTRAAMRLLNEDKLFGIRARAKSKVGIADAETEIHQILLHRHRGEDDFTIVTQGTMLTTLQTILGMLTYMLVGIAMISMLVAGIGIMNIMLVNVTERTREIGIRRAVGAKRSDILKQFLAEAVALSMAGGMSGLLGSVFLTHFISWFSGDFDMRAPWWIMPPALLLSVGTGVVFGVWPARKASHIETIDALRYE